MKRKLLITAVVALAMLAVPGAAMARHHHKVRDRNHDGIPDKWEKRFHLSLKVNQAKRDPDHDGLNNRQEFQDRTNPRKADTDGDGLNDGQEMEVGDNPNNPDTNNDGVDDGDEINGTVQSFDSGTGLLTILLPDGTTTRSGTVTSSTEVKCEGADGEHGDLHSSDNGGDSGDGDHSGSSSGDENQANEANEPNEANEANEANEENDNQAACTIAPGDVVHEAKLATDANGNATFTKVELEK